MSRSVFEEVDKIHWFVKGCLKDELLAGFDVLASRHKGRSYIIAKRCNSFRVAYVHTSYLDYIDPYERAIIKNAIHFAIYGTKMDVDALNNEMVSLSIN